MAKKRIGKLAFTTEELDRQFSEASRLGRESVKSEARARQAHYDGQHRKLAIELLDGASVAIPIEHIQGLSTASAEDVSQITLTVYGDTIQWDKLGLDLSVAGLVAGVFGGRNWMAELGRKGGRATTPAKTAASRENGLKGGRPRKVQPQPPSFSLNFDSILVDVQMLQPEIDMLGLTLSGQSQQPMKDLIKYKDGLNSLERLTAPLKTLSSILLSGAAAVIAAKVDGVEEDYYDATFPVAA